MFLAVKTYRKHCRLYFNEEKEEWISAPSQKSHADPDGRSLIVLIYRLTIAREINGYFIVYKI